MKCESDKMVDVKLKNGDIRKVESGTSILDIAQSLGQGIYKAACCADVNGKIEDLRHELKDDCSLELLTFDDENGKKTYWHTSAHVLAQAVKRLYPNVKLAIGPAVASGFYYDFDKETPFLPGDLLKIEEEANRIIKEDLGIECFTLPYEEAIKLMADSHEKYKVELINDLKEKGENISFYRQGEFVDLCRGPHLKKTGDLKAFKVLNCTGAYWKGNSEGPVLQRIYGISFPKLSMLEDHLRMLEEAKKRDHRKLGQQLELYDFFEEGRGFPFFLPNGMVLRNALEDFWKAEHKKAGYVEVKTPIILNKELWVNSGHWDHYKENMYMTEIDEIEHAIKPMNCPGGMLVYRSRPKSYRDLPIKMAEMGLVHRHELSGVLHGLMRVRCFTQDDAHIFATADQIEKEVVAVLHLIDKMYSTFGFKYKIELSTRPENSMGTNEQWEKATNALRLALESIGKEYKVNEGDGAFYGPKIDFHLEDVLKRTWQCGTVQLDFQMPERFDLHYTAEDGQKYRPIVIHRTVFGSIERFIGILTEHFAGAFPVWLAPVQVMILPISDKFMEYAKQVENTLQQEGIRVELDCRNEKIGYKIREGQIKKIPYMVVVGEKEQEDNMISLRHRCKGDLGEVALDDFTKVIKDEIANKTID